MTDSTGIDLVKKVAESLRICMYCTSLGARQTSRPMSTAKVDEQGDIWFFTSSEHDVAEDSKGELVHLLYADNGNQKYLSIKGKAHVIDDSSKAEELWNPILNAWFPEGLETHDLRLIRVNPTSGEYWEGVSMIRTLYDAVKAKITGEEGSYGEHKALNLD